MCHGLRSRLFLQILLCNFVLTSVCTAAIATAAGRVIEEQYKIQVPGPTDQIVTGLDMDGDHLLLATARNFVEPDLSVWSEVFVYAFQRSDRNEWLHVRTLAVNRTPWESAVAFRVALEGNTAAIESNDLRIFENSEASGWRQVTTFPSISNHYIYGGSVVIGDGTIVTGGPACAWSAYRKNASGRWAQVASATDPTADSNCFADLDVAGSTVVAGVSKWYESSPGEIRIYDNFASTPTSTLAAPNGDVYFGSDVAIHGDTLIDSSPRNPGVRSYRSIGGGWPLVGQAATADAFVNQQALNSAILAINQEFVVGAYPFDNLRGRASGSVPVFRKNSTGALTEVARLLASDASAETVLGTYVAMSGRRIAAAAGYGGQAAVYVFELPTNLSQPTNAQDDFESGNLARWSTLAGSRFAVVSTPRSRVLRQSSLTGDAGAYLSAMDWTDQSIQADVRATAFDGADRWFGLVVRRTDAANYYYVTVRAASNVIQLRRMLNGHYQPIASAQLPVTLNRDYRLRLEAVGTRIRGYVNGELMVEARDTSHQHGHAGFQMYRARAEYDNVVVTPNPQLTICSDSFDYSVDERWMVKDGAWQEAWSEVRIAYGQSSTKGDARAVTGVSASDQILQVDTRVMSFAQSSNAWIGLMGRYVDSRNYYYVTLRNNGTISLRKLVNGAATALATTNMNVLPQQWYRVRLEIIGNALRVFVDDRLVLQARDSTFGMGRYGLVTYNASAEYENMLGWQP